MNYDHRDPEYKDWARQQYKRHSTDFREGRMSEAVYRASLYALGWRGQDISTEVNLNWPSTDAPHRGRMGL